MQKSAIYSPASWRRIWSSNDDLREAERHLTDLIIVMRTIHHMVSDLYVKKHPVVFQPASSQFLRILTHFIRRDDAQIVFDIYVYVPALVLVHHQTLICYHSEPLSWNSNWLAPSESLYLLLCLVIFCRWGTTSVITTLGTGRRHLFSGFLRSSPLLEKRIATSRSSVFMNQKWTFAKCQKSLHVISLMFTTAFKS